MFPTRVSDWAAACVVDTAGLFVWRFGESPTGPINKWYSRFGLAAYILSMIIGVVLAQLVTTAIGGPWNPLLFCAVAVHDVFFALIVVPAVPTGQNTIMDLMKEYTRIPWPQGILVVDAIYMVLTSVIAMLLSAADPSAAWITLIVPLYVTMYVLYTVPAS